MAFDASTSPTAHTTSQTVAERRLPRVYGLVMAITFSLAVWVGLVWAGLAVYGLFHLSPYP